MIDEKKLVEDIEELPLIHGRYDHENGNIDFIDGCSVMYRTILNLIENQPKLDVPDTNVGKMDREFEELEVTYPPDDVCTYPEYRGKPYFAIKYKENGEHFVGYGTYKPEVLSQYLRDYFMPLAMPQEPKWIPCSEGLPELNKKVLVTYEKLNRGTLLVGYDKRIITKGGEIWQGKGNRVLAWLDREFPEPYKGE